jgi:hypothetical protein
MQRGGAPENIHEWIDAVVKKVKTIADDPRLQVTKENPFGSYKFSDLKYNVQTDGTDNKLQLPNMSSTIPDPAFNLNSSNTDPVLDIRNVCTTIGEEMADVMLPNATPANFHEYITSQIINRTENNIKDWVNFVVYVENKLRDIARIEDKIDTLGDSDRYPLLIWILLMNPPATPAPAVPIPVPAAQVAKELAQFTEMSSEPVAAIPA